MSKLVSGSLGVIAVAALGVGGAAYWSGMQMENWYQEALLSVAQQTQEVKLSMVRYERGWFSSRISTAVSMDTDDGQEVSFTINQQVYHGPLPLGAGVSPRPSMGVVRTTLNLESSDWTRQLGKLYGEQEPIVAVSRIDFGGASTTTVTMPPLRLENVEEVQQLDYAGLHGVLRVAARGAAVQGNFEMPRLTFTGKAAEGASSGGQVQLQNLQLNINQQQGAFGLLLGESTLQLAKLEMQDPGQAPFSATGLKVSGAVTQQSPQLVAAEFRLAAAQINAEQQQGSVNLLIALRNLDGATVEKLQQWQEKAANDAAAGQNLDEGIALLKALLASKPQFSVDAQATTKEGASQAQITLHFQDFASDNLSGNPMTLMEALHSGSADFAAPKTLVEQVLLTLELGQLAEGVEGSAAQTQALQAQAAARVEQELKQWLAAGFIKLDTNRYVSNVRFANGQLSLNGRNIPLPSFTTEESDQQELPMEPDGGALEDEAPTTDAPAPR